MIEFYFDPISPYSWLAASKLDSLQTEFDRAIVVRPVLFAGLLKAHGTKGPAVINSICRLPVLPIILSIRCLR